MLLLGVGLLSGTCTVPIWSLLASVDPLKGVDLIDGHHTFFSYHNAPTPLKLY